MELVVGDQMEAILALADKAVAGMKEASDGKAPDARTETNASTFANLANVMENLSTLARRDRTDRDRMARALSRIANLQVRSSKELLEHRNWEKLLLEVQAVAQDAIGVSG